MKMKNSKYFTQTTTALTALVALTYSSTALAGISDIRTSNNQIGIQVILTNVDYTETGNGINGSQTGTLDTETGNVPGYALSISIMQDLWLGDDYIEAENDYSSGNTNYTGALCTPLGVCGAYGSYVGTSSATLINYSARYGKGLIVNGVSMLTPYLEMGSHEWDRGVNYGETYTHNYFGFGAMGQYSPISKLVFSANALIGRTFGSYIAVNGAFSGELGDSTLYKVSVAADNEFAQNLHWNAGVSYMSFKYGISAVYPVGGGVAWEPDSKTNYTTVKIGLGYAF
jgi:hypothetical protein